jgi:hypothetical protein
VIPARAVWGEAVRRMVHARLLLDPVVRELNAERRAARGDFVGRDVLVDGRWATGPAAGDGELLERRLRDIDDRLGEHLGIGPRPR